MRKLSPDFRFSCKQNVSPGLSSTVNPFTSVESSSNTSRNKVLVGNFAIWAKLFIFQQWKIKRQFTGNFRAIGAAPGFWFASCERVWRELFMIQSISILQNDWYYHQWSINFIHTAIKFIFLLTYSVFLSFNLLCWRQSGILSVHRYGNDFQILKGLRTFPHYRLHQFLANNLN